MVSERTPRLVSAVANPKRRIAESSIRKPNDIVIFVEGEFDRMFFKRYSSNPNLTFKNIGKKKGKSDICNIVSSTPEYYGIVDMDYDFDSIKRAGQEIIKEETPEFDDSDPTRGFAERVCALKQPEEPLIQVQDELIDRSENVALEMIEEESDNFQFLASQVKGL